MFVAIIKTMRKEAALPIRLDKQTKETLTGIARTTGLSVSSLVRMLVKSFVEEYDRNHGAVVIPPQWEKSSQKGLRYRIEPRDEGKFSRVAEQRSTY